MDENGGRMHLLAHGVDGDGDDVDGELWMKMKNEIKIKIQKYFFL
jgi:hypothetical protein